MHYTCSTGDPVYYIKKDLKLSLVNNSDSQYDVVEQREGVNAYESLSFGGGGSEEGSYQPLTFRGEELSIYEHPQTISTKP